jgi:hypothetical protein
MIHLNTNQLEDAQEIAHNQEVNRARRVLVLYKKDDPSFGLAMFRTQANNHTTEILARTVARKRLLKDTREWLATWLNEPNDSVIGNGIRDYCAAIERASGLAIIR